MIGITEVYPKMLSEQNIFNFLFIRYDNNEEKDARHCVFDDGLCVRTTDRL